jgi:hypothetical protein
MANKGRRSSGNGSRARKAGASASPRIRVRAKPLDKVDEGKLALAFYLIAKQLIEDRTDASAGAAATQSMSESEPRLDDSRSLA